ncbi:MAG: Trk system potassium transporter TrkA [Prevotella sp.]|uniref:Trk system potassium transporter TrkA n=1 Tax=Prevotella sp. TaxID=59823 RepID=UPI002A27E56F|nr:Trk system potassium transporter TrkA [Prevotella sp.]MDD7318872.1 Trk system potassium transporter TrkA [Prevotellaceae bacterium]MDY4019251.1 Trk system potassium transporter TrkA [Prevotella sp.]
MKIIIAGAYAIGTHLAKLLSRSNHDTVLIDENEARLADISGDYDLMTYLASPASFKTLKEIGANSADLFIAVTPDQHLNMTSCIMAHSMGAKKTVARVDDNEFMEEKNLEFFKQMGIDSLIYPENLAANEICNGLKMSWVRQRWDVHNSSLVMLGIKMRESAEILNKPLKELSKPETPYYVVAIKRGEDTIIPRGDDVLKLHDMVFFMTKRDTISYVRQIVGKEHYVDVKNVMVMGGGMTAVRAMAKLPEYMNAKIIEINEERCEELNELIDNKRVMVINGDGRDLSLLRDEGIGNTQAFVALTSNAETNILACLTAKRMGVRKTVAIVENMDYVRTAESLDIGTIVNKKALAASHIYQMMLDEDVSVSNIKFFTTANADVAEFLAQQGSKVTRKRVFELGLPKGVAIGGLVRNGVGKLVSGGTQIEAGDVVVVFCHNINMEKIEKFFKC